MVEKEWRVVANNFRGRFKIHDSEGSARRHMESAYQFHSGKDGTMGHVGRIQSRPKGTQGDDSTWNDET